MDWFFNLTEEIIETSKTYGVYYPDFEAYREANPDSEMFCSYDCISRRTKEYSGYIPTRERLNKGGDWYWNFLNIFNTKNLAIIMMITPEGESFFEKVVCEKDLSFLERIQSKIKDVISNTPFKF